ncbi:MAG TPA: GNAT family N-acetyltransferase [Gaiellaceae bacterium]|nr:GNAT family N-acetyltransferase [Gaiellaceae bacterium]
MREDLPDCILYHQPHWSFAGAGSVYRIRFGDDVEKRVEAVRSWFRGQGRKEFVWWVGSSATPDDLGDRLIELGGELYGDDPILASMICTEPPPAADGIEVRRVETLEGFSAAREISWKDAGFSESQLAEVRATMAERWEQRQRSGNHAVFLAYVDDRPVASAEVVLLPFGGFLSGASTLAEYRGRGVFRALVRARWDEAVRRGTPALIVGAGKMSRPILERIGFEKVADLRLLLDRSGL